MQDPNCIFCRIVTGEIPSRKAYEDDSVFAFHDIHPVAPVHVLLIPKQHIGSLADVEDGHAQVLGRMLVVASRIAREQGSEEGFRFIVNTGRIGRQEVFHVHAHIVGGKEPLGPMVPRAKA